MVKKGICIDFLQDAGCGLLYLPDEPPGSRIVFVHFRDVDPKPRNGWQGLAQGDVVEFCLSREKGEQFHRPFAATGDVGKDGKEGFVRLLAEKQTAIHFCAPGEEGGCPEGRQLVLTGKVPRGWRLDERFRKGGCDIIFARCSWDERANFIQWQTDGDLVFLGCTFHDAFTLKEACIAGDVHMEGCDFSGVGGASFRGLQAKALYLDFGVRGPQDMVWLNEMHIQGNVVVGGMFPGSIQVMRIQDNRVKSTTADANESLDRACFRRLFLGKEFYRSQSINRTEIHGRLEIHGLRHGEGIHIENAELQDIELTGLSGGVDFTCLRSKLRGNMSLRSLRENRRDASSDDCLAEMGFMDLRGTYIEGHFALENVRFDGELNMDDATVERVMRLHQVRFAKGGGLKMARLSVERLVMDDFSSLYGDKREFSILNAPRFFMLQRESEDKSKPAELVQEYVLLKNLLAQEGQLKLEDEAYFNMRRRDCKRRGLGYWLMNDMFGWGVRLTNIVLSAVVLVVVFALVFSFMWPAVSGLDAVLLSVQAMFMAFFGEWRPEIVAGMPVSWAVTLESVLGVIFVTVFVGAYVRKLLR